MFEQRVLLTIINFYTYTQAVNYHLGQSFVADLFIVLNPLGIIKTSCFDNEGKEIQKNTQTGIS